jgi:hypothetical protein
MMKEMGLDLDDMACAYDDPELAALEKEMNKGGKQFNHSQSNIVFSF